MAFYNLSKEERTALVATITKEIKQDLNAKKFGKLKEHFSNEDTYIRKAAYTAIGRLYKQRPERQQHLLEALNYLLKSDHEKIRQTTVNAAGEIGMHHFEIVQPFFDKGLFDEHHSVRNAVIGSLKKMGAKNPTPTLNWARRYLNHPDKEVRREICHGIELRGRTHPQDILPMLKQLQFDETARVRNTLVHVLGQIAYKKGCLETVVTALNSWENKELVRKALDEIVDVHERYKSFAALSQDEAIAYIDTHFRQ